MAFQYTNSSAAPPSHPTSNFTITAPPSTDIWRKPPNHNAFTAPILHRTLPLSHFHRIRVTISGPWKTLYDQGGLLFSRPCAADGEKKWVKAGIEFFDGRACASVVAKDNWADWSLVEIESDAVTVELAREAVPETDEPSLWVYLVEDGGRGRRRPIREVTWAFEGGEEGGEEECWVGVYAAKPTPTPADPSEELEVRFSGLMIE